MIGVILAGGANTRYPSEKALIELDGSTLMQRAIGTLTPVVDGLYLSTNEPEKYFRFGLPMIGDVIRGKGPMGGIISVFEATGADSAFFMACDMPFPSAALAALVIERLGNADACVAVRDGRAEPLFAAYSKQAASKMRDALDAGNGSLRGFLDKANTVRIEGDDLRRADPSGWCFVNINTPEDLRSIPH